MEENLKTAIKEVIKEEYPQQPNRIIRSYLNPAEKFFLYMKIVFFACVFGFVGLVVYKGNKIMTEWTDLKFKSLQTEVQFKEYQNQQYQANMVVVEKKDLAKMIAEKVSEELAAKMKDNNEQAVSAGSATVIVPDVVETQEISSPSDEFHLETSYFKVDATYSREKEQWFSEHLRKSVPIEINWLETTTSKDEINGIRNFYIEALEKPINSPPIKLKSELVQVMVLKPSEDPSKIKDNLGLFKWKIFENKTVRITFVGLGAYGLFKLIQK